MDTPGFRAQAVEAYVPLVVTGASPAGGGTALEQVNRLTNRRRISYSADGSAAYRLPEEAVGVAAVQVSGRAWTPRQLRRREPGLYLPDSPGGGDGQRGDHLPGRLLRPGQGPGDAVFQETYNGDTDTRLFLYGDGSNTCIYSG